MIVSFTEDYPGELAERDPTELAEAVVAQLRFSKGHGSAGYKSPADFQSARLWTLHGSMAEVGRRRLDRLKGDVLGMLEGIGGEA